MLPFSFLQIIADDVKCTHGCTVSDLDEEELFYFRCAKWSCFGHLLPRANFTLSDKDACLQVSRCNIRSCSQNAGFQLWAGSGSRAVRQGPAAPCRSCPASHAVLVCFKLMAVSSLLALSHYAAANACNRHAQPILSSMAKNCYRQNPRLA